MNENIEQHEKTKKKTATIEDKEKITSQELHD